MVEVAVWLQAACLLVSIVALIWQVIADVVSWRNENNRRHSDGDREAK